MGVILHLMFFYVTTERKLSVWCLTLVPTNLKPLHCLTVFDTVMFWGLLMCNAPQVVKERECSVGFGDIIGLITCSVCVYGETYHLLQSMLSFPPADAARCF